MTFYDEIVPTPSRKVHEALWAATLHAIDLKGYVPCSMATATRNATITEVLGVECYSKTDVFTQAMDDALLNGAATARPMGLLHSCPPPRPDVAHGRKEISGQNTGE